MIKEILTNKEHDEVCDKPKKFDSLIRAFNEKGLFPFSLDNPSIITPTKISSPSKKINNKQKIEFSSLEKDFTINNYNYGIFSENKLTDCIYSLPLPNSFELGQKNFFDCQKDIKEEENSLIGKKKIRQISNKEFEGILLLSKKKEKRIEEKNNPIICYINDEYFDKLINIYKNEEINIGKVKENQKTTELNLKFKNFNETNQIVKVQSINIKNNSNNNIKEQISCICLKSKCLNNYCRCHKNGNTCNKNCRCYDCRNNSINNKTVSNRLKLISIDNNTCKCKSSNCFFQYCNCKRRGIFCSKNCLCSNNCKNYNKFLGDNKISKEDNK